jgi:hypothetical protein
VLKYAFALIEEAFTIRPRIRKRRAVEEAERLEADVRSAKAKIELVRLAAAQLEPTAPHPVSVELYVGEENEPPPIAAAS